MQLFVLIMVLMLGAFEQWDLGQTHALSRLGDVWVGAMMVLPKLTIMGLYALQCRLVTRHLATPAATRALRRLELATSLYRLSTLSLFALDLSIGGLMAVRTLIGNLILIDELLIMAPTLLMLAAGWWLYYPIDRRLREATLIGRLDAGLSVHPIQTRTEFILNQFRHQVSILLVPLLLLLAWRDTVIQFVPHRSLTALGFDLQLTVGLAGAGLVFFFTPVLIRWIWDTAPLPPGDIRSRLLEMCRIHHVRVRDLLLWRTFGGLGNAAVMGLLAPVRFILLTDLLLETVPHRQIEAIMAHELAHVKKHHMFWMAICIFAIMGLLLAIGEGLQLLLTHQNWPFTAPQFHQHWQIGLLAFALAGWAPIFGWISRRFERQADAFALKYLTRHPTQSEMSTPAFITPEMPQSISTARDTDPPSNDSSQRVTYEAAATMVDALAQVALINNIHPRRKSWRHGSIAWRQHHLRNLVGVPINRLPIDRHVRMIQWGAMLLLIGWIALEWMFTGSAGGVAPSSAGPALVLAAAFTVMRPGKHPLHPTTRPSSG